MDEDNDGRFPDNSPVEIRYPPIQAGRERRPVGVAVASWVDCKSVRAG